VFKTEYFLLWVMTPYSLVDEHHHFGGIYPALRTPKVQAPQLQLLLAFCKFRLTIHQRCFITLNVNFAASTFEPPEIRAHGPRHAIPK
jgi:hypothetical protein